MTGLMVVVGNIFLTQEYGSSSTSSLYTPLYRDLGKENKFSCYSNKYRATGGEVLQISKFLYIRDMIKTKKK